MIALNETNEYAAEVAFTLPLDSDPLTGLTGWTFTLGQVQIKLPGQPWANADLLKIVEKGYGRFCVRLTAAQCMVAGDVFVRADIDGTQYYFGADVIGLLGGDIQENSSIGSVSFYLPLATDPINGTPLLAYDWTEGGTYPSTTPRVRICLPDGVYQDADVALIETIGYGGFKLNLSAAHTTKRGKVFVYANVPGYQRFEGYGTILGIGTASGSPTPPGPTPVPAPYTPDDEEYVNQVAHGLNRLAEQFRSGDANYGVHNEAAQPLSDFLGPFTPNVTSGGEVEVPVIEDVTITNHLQKALNRLPAQFRSGALAYDAPATTTQEEVIGTFTPSAPSAPFEITVPDVAPGVAGHVATALSRLPAQFRSSE